MLYWIVGTLAAFGAWCLLSLTAGWLVSGRRRGTLVYYCGRGEDPEHLLRHYGWMHDMGFLKEPVWIVGGAETPAEAARWAGRYSGVRFCTPEEILPILEQERSEFGGIGNGNHTGHHCRGDLSEL